MSKPIIAHLYILPIEEVNQPIKILWARTGKMEEVKSIRAIYQLFDDGTEKRYAVFVLKKLNPLTGRHHEVIVKSKKKTLDI